MKEEEIQSSASSSSLSPQPMRLNDMGPPPFLTKTFDMVEDPSSDSIVSWNRARNSFIVWDSHKFSTTLLPKYFKHSNFSSFIRQLNTYGFRKVDPDRWEFANEGFLGGQRHLLKNIRRRRNIAQNTQQQGLPACVELGQYGLESDLQRLTRDRNILMTEIVKLRQQQQNSNNQVRMIEETLQMTERKQQQMMHFLAKALNNPAFIQQVLQKVELKGGLGGIESRRKRRLPPSQSTENLLESVVSAEDHPNESPEELGSIEMEIETLFSAAIADESTCDTKDPIIDSIPTSGHMTSLGDDIVWEELLNEDVEVEDLVANLSEWGEDIEELADDLGYLK